MGCRQPFSAIVVSASTLPAEITGRNLGWPTRRERTFHPQTRLVAERTGACRRRGEPLLRRRRGLRARCTASARCRRRCTSSHASSDGTGGSSERGPASARPGSQLLPRPGAFSREVAVCPVRVFAASPFRFDPGPTIEGLLIDKGMGHRFEDALIRENENDYLLFILQGG